MDSEKKRPPVVESIYNRRSFLCQDCISTWTFWEVVQKSKAAGETYRQIAQSYGLKMSQVKELAYRQHRKARLIEHGYVPRGQGRPRKSSNSESACQKELATLRMQVELLKNFLSEVGRR